MKLAWMKAFTATATNIRQIRLTTMTPMTFTLLNQVCPSQPTVWNMLQKPWVRWNQMAANHNIYIRSTHQCPNTVVRSR